MSENNIHNELDRYFNNRMSSKERSEFILEMTRNKELHSLVLAENMIRDVELGSKENLMLYNDNAAMNNFISMLGNSSPASEVLSSSQPAQSLLSRFGAKIVGGVLGVAALSVVTFFVVNKFSNNTDKNPTNIAPAVVAPNLQNSSNGGNRNIKDNEIGNNDENIQSKVSETVSSEAVPPTKVDDAKLNNNTTVLSNNNDEEFENKPTHSNKLKKGVITKNDNLKNSEKSNTSSQAIKKNAVRKGFGEWDKSSESPKVINNKQVNAEFDVK